MHDREQALDDFKTGRYIVFNPLYPNDVSRRHFFSAFEIRMTAESVIAMASHISANLQLCMQLHNLTLTVQLPSLEYFVCGYSAELLHSSLVAERQEKTLLATPTFSCKYLLGNGGTHANTKYTNKINAARCVKILQLLCTRQKM